MSTNVHGRRQRGRAVAHAATEFELPHLILLARSPDASRVRKRPEHGRAPCHSRTDSVRFEQEDAACADESVFPSCCWSHGARRLSGSPPRAIASATTASSCPRRGPTACP